MNGKTHGNIAIQIEYYSEKEMCKAWVGWEGAKSFYALSGHISCLVLNPEAVLTTLFRSFYGDFFTQAELIKSLAIKLSLPPWKFGEC